MEKIKQFLESEKEKDVLIVIIVILVGLGSFELGRLSKENNNSGIKIEYPNRSETQGANVVSSINTSGPTAAFNTKATETTTAGKNYFASSRGSKYYSIGCSAGKTIKQANRIYFATIEEAQSAGYTLSSSCK